MSNNNESLSRDALIEKVEDALIACPGRAVVVAGGVAKMPVEAHAAAAVDAVLSAVAADLEARSGPRALPPFGISDPRGELNAKFALGAYAHFVRGLLGEDDKEGPTP